MNMFFAMTRFAENGKVFIAIIKRVKINVVNTNLLRIVNSFFSNKTTFLTGVIIKFFYFISSFFTHRISISRPMSRLTTFPVFTLFRMIVMPSTLIGAKVGRFLLNCIDRSIVWLATPLTGELKIIFCDSPFPSWVFFSNEFMLHSPRHRAFSRTKNSVFAFIIKKCFFTEWTRVFDFCHIGNYTTRKYAR